MKNIGIDIVEVERFRDLLHDQKAHVLETLFTQEEILYGDSFTDRATHFAGTFALKEAASKALGPRAFPVLELEVRRDEQGAPHLWHKDSPLPILVSISHTTHTAVAVAIA